MNYRHAYHAGSFTDVVKHVILFALLSTFTRKETPFCYIDTHAGIGYYDLFSEFAKKTKEYESGIEKIIAAERPPTLVARYLDCVHQINNDLTHTQYSSLRYYPGSPVIARSLGRPHDRFLLCELHREDYQTLHECFAHDRQVAVHHLDGFLGLKAFLPPHERRGIVLIDPPYENPDEFTRIVKALPMALKRWETGCFCIWYPIKEKARLQSFHHALETTIHRPIFIAELSIYPDVPNHLNGCGMAIINPPYKIDEIINELLPWLWKALTIKGQGEYLARFLKSM